MTVSIDQLRKFTEQLNLKYQEVELSSGKALLLGFPMGGSSDRIFGIQVRSYENGEMFEASAVNLIPTELCQKSNHKGPFLFYLLNTAWETKLGAPEVDKDGEVRVLVEIPVADAEMTLKQYDTILKTLALVAIKIGLEGEQILEKGELEETQAQNKNPKSREIMAAMIDMLGTAGGREKLLKIVADEEYPEEVRKTALLILKAAASSPDSL